MGYHTRYGLTMNPFRPDILMELARDPEGKFPFNENGEAEDSTTWYDHETDMAAVSQRYPDVVFDLHGAGEEQGDEWHKYFKNGKVQTCRAKVEFDPFDEAKLEDVK